MTSPSRPSPASAPPRHVAIIMDGNGRWAEQRGLPRIEGHRRGVENVRTVVRVAGEVGIEVLTLYAFSVENWDRPRDEVDALMDLLERFLRHQRGELLKQSLRLETIGLVGKLPERVRRPLEEVKAATAHGTRGTLVLALNYGARTELVEAVRRYGEDVQAGRRDPAKLDYPELANLLDTARWPDPDLLIRTSGEMRLSNFLLLQSAYTELVFSPTLWPDFGEEAFRAALSDYERRERRFGRTSAQLKPATEATPSAL